MNADRWFKISTGRYGKLVGLIALACLDGCASQTVITADSKSDGEVVTAPREVRIDPVHRAQQPAPLQAAQLTLHVGKTGKLARLGHNHLITAPLSGSAWLDARGTLHAQASVRTDDLVVDDPQRRATRVAAGNGDYASLPSAKNIRDTRANMLGPQVLDADQFPEISATARAPAAGAEFRSGMAGSLNAVFSLTLRGAVTTQPAKLDWQSTDRGIAWTTTFTLSHQQLGMTPFSALGGALRVADDLKVELQGLLASPFSLGSD